MAMPKVGVEAVIEGVSKFQADSAKINKSLGAIEKSSGGLGSAISSLTSRLGGLASGLLKVGAAGASIAIVGIGAGLAKAAYDGLSFNNTMEQTSARINAFTKDAGATAEILKTIREEANKTPFAFQEMADAAASLLPATKLSGKSLDDLIKSAEILAASNPLEGLKGASFALKEAISGDFTSIIERFNLSRSSINQWKKEGVDNMEIVRRAMGELGLDSDLVSNMALTMSGRWSTFLDTITSVEATITKPLFDVLSSGLGTVNDWLAQNQPLLQSFADMLAGEVANAITLISTKAMELFTAFQAGGVSGLAGALGIPPDVIAGITAAADEINRLISIFTTQGAGGGFMVIFDSLKASIAAALPGLAASILAGIPIVLTTLTNAIADHFRNNVPNWQAALAGWATSFWSWTNTVINTVGVALVKILMSINAWVASPEAQTGLNNAGRAIGQAIVTGLQLFAQNIPELSMVVAKIIAGLAAAVLALTADLIVIGGQITAGIISGILSSMGIDLRPATFNELRSILSGIGNDIGIIATELGKRIVGYIKTGWNTAWMAVRDWGKNFEEIIKEAKEVLDPEKWIEIGISIIDGILEGIKKSQDKVLEMLKSLAADALQSAKDAIGFGSPAAAFVPLGASMVEGTVAGVEGAADQLTGTLKNLGQSALQSLMTGMTIHDEGFLKPFISSLNIGSQLKHTGAGLGGAQYRDIRTVIKREIGNNIDLLAGGPNAIKNKVLQIAGAMKLNPNLVGQFTDLDKIIKDVQTNFAAFQQELRVENIAKSIGTAGQFAAIGSSFADMAKEASTAATSRISILRSFLASKDKTLTTSQQIEDLMTGNTTTSSFTIDRVGAQKELNQLLDDEYKRRQEIANLEKAQQQLGFLQQQVQLLQLIQAQGLKPKDILGGLTLGINASVTDLLAATGNVVTAMVQQINNDLQIHSPSAVMAYIGRQMMTGLQSGIISMVPSVNAILSASVAAPITPLAAGALAGGSSSVTNNFYTGGNNISNGVDAATFEARVLQVIRRNL